MQIGDVYHILYECQVTAQGECELVCKLEMFTISYMSVKLLLKANANFGNFCFEQRNYNL